jgi:hypothetical protein
MKLSIDSEFQSLISPLTPEERDQLVTNLLAEGCRDALVVWAGEPPERICQSCPPGTPFSRAASDVEVEAGTVVWRCEGCGHVEPRSWVLLDGHTRYPIVTTHNVPFEIAEVKGVQTRDEAVDWIVNQQLGRRNLSDEQKSYLRGKRYNLEKRQDGGHGDQHSGDHCDPPTTAQRLAAEYRVGEATIKRDGQYAEAVDTVVETFGPEVRHEVLAGHTKLPKHTIVKSAQAVRRLKRRLQPEDFSFMRGLPRGFHQDALKLLAELPTDEHALVNALLDKPGVPAREMLDVILRRFPAQPPDARQAIYALDASEDPRDRARALREAAGGSPIPPPLLRFLDRVNADLQRTVKHIDQCVQLDPTAPWVAQLQALSTQIQALQEGKLAQMQAEVHAYFEADPEANIPADERVDDHKDRDGAVDHSMREVEVPAGETVDEDNTRDGAVEQVMPEVDPPANKTVGDAKDRDGAIDDRISKLDVTRESAAASNLTTSRAPALDCESQAPVEWEIGVLPCGRCEATQTRRAVKSGRIYCDDCHAVYNPSDGHWRPGERAKDRATSTLGVGLG